MIQQTPVLILGASIAGLACAACLHQHDIAFSILEKEKEIASPWRNHYQRLHLHTSKGFSHLPYKKFDDIVSRYPSRQDVIDYLESYQRTFAIQPRFDTEAMQLQQESNGWLTQTNGGDMYQSKYIIVATGAYHKPKTFACQGIETFEGPILHSSQYKTGQDFTGKKVLVIGFGNSACEIAIDLYEQGAKPFLSVRSPVNVVPRDLLRIPIQHYSLLLSKLPSRLADAIIAPLMRLKFGDIAKLGLQRMKYGAFQQFQKDGTSPALDVGTINHIRQGHIAVYNGIACIDNNTVQFVDGKEQSCDAIIAAIGYEQNHLPIFDVNNKPINLFKSNKASEESNQEGLYCCGFTIQSTGLIRRIATEAQQLAKDIAKKERSAKQKAGHR